MRHAKEHRRGTLVKAILFFGVLAVCLVISLIPSLHPAESSQEGRELTKFPEFSQEALWNGTYFDGIDLWFSDTLPGRDKFFELNKHIRELYGIHTVEIHGEVTQGDDIPDTPFTGAD